jgi:hypothetical protein
MAGRVRADAAGQADVAAAYNRIIDRHGATTLQLASALGFTPKSMRTLGWA